MRYLELLQSLLLHEVRAAKPQVGVQQLEERAGKVAPEDERAEQLHQAQRLVEQAQVVPRPGDTRKP
jgi:hypothetical protein